MTEGIKVANVGDIDTEEAMVIDQSLTGFSEPIAIFRTEDDEYYALTDTCSHEDASLAEGWIEGCEVECPIHTARFCLKTGAVQCMPATEDVASHKLEVRGDEIWIFPGVSAVDG